MLRRARVGSRPRPEVELAWGSRSTRSVRWPSSARAAPRLIAVVVLPTPPFWLTTAMIGGVVVANILGLGCSSDAISGGICSDSRRDLGRCLAALLRAHVARAGYRVAPARFCRPAGPPTPVLAPPPPAHRTCDANRFFPARQPRLLRDRKGLPRGEATRLRRPTPRPESTR